MSLLLLFSLGIFAIILLTILYIIFVFRQNAKYFKKHGVPYLETGSSLFFRMLSGKITLVEFEKEFYRLAKAKESPILGISELFGSISIYVMDLELIKSIYVRDFDHFVNRRPVMTQQANYYFNRMLFNMESDQWKGIRAKLSPSFTTGRIRKMFQIFQRSSVSMCEYLDKQTLVTGQDQDFSQIFSKFAMDVIASTAFAVDSKCWQVEPGQMSEFEKFGKDFQFDFKPLMLVKFIVMNAAPWVADKLKLEVLNNKPQDFFAGVIRNVIKYRKEKGERGDDFLQLMIDAREGLLKADEETTQVMHGSIENSEGTGSGMMGSSSKVTFDEDDIVANCLLFLLGGFGTTQSLLLFSVYALGLEQEVQQKVLDEITAVKERNGGNITYEGVQEMVYLDMVLNETLRMYPPAARTERSCTKDYPVPGTNFVMKKGTIVGIPIHPIHHDPRYFPEPEKFLPERFSPEGKATRHAYAFMPFGHGPRNCIGMRFALIEVKLVIAQLVHNFHIEPCSKTMIPVQFDSDANLKPKGGMWLKVTKRQK